MGSYIGIPYEIQGEKTYLPLFVYKNEFDVNTNTSQFTLAFFAQPYEIHENHTTTVPYEGEGNFTGYYIIDGVKQEFSHYTKINKDIANDILFSSRKKLTYTQTHYNLPIELYVKGAVGTVFEDTIVTAKTTLKLNNGFTDYPKINWCNSFTDETGPNIDISYKDKSIINQMWIGLGFSDDTTSAFVWQTFGGCPASYQMTLSQNDTNTLDQNSTHASKRNVVVMLCSRINGLDYYDTFLTTYKIVNANPTVSPTVEDINSTTLALTGNKNKLIRYYSTAQCTANSSAKKYSSIVAQNINNGGTTIYEGTGTFYNVPNGNFRFYAQDSRGFTCSKTITKSIIPYVKLTCNGDAKATLEPNNDIKLNVDINGNYYNGSFGVTNNSLTVWYRYRKKNDAWNNWVVLNADIKNNQYSATISIPNLPGGVAYEVEGCARDALAGDVYSTTNTITAEPIFDWSYGDFNFNVPVSLNNNKISNLATPDVDTDAVNKAFLEERLKTKAPSGSGLGYAGGPAIKASEVDNLYANGFYRTTEAYIDAKGHNYGGVMLLVCSWNTKYSTQLMFNVTGGFYIRQCYAGTWKDWIFIKRLYA